MKIQATIGIAALALFMGNQSAFADDLACTFYGQTTILHINAGSNSVAFGDQAWVQAVFTDTQITWTSQEKNPYGYSYSYTFDRYTGNLQQINPTVQANGSMTTNPTNYVCAKAGTRVD